MASPSHAGAVIEALDLAKSWEVLSSSFHFHNSGGADLHLVMPKRSGRTHLAFYLSERWGIPVVVPNTFCRADWERLHPTYPGARIMVSGQFEVDRIPFAIYDNTPTTDGPGIWLKDPSTHKAFEEAAAKQHQDQMVSDEQVTQGRSEIEDDRRPFTGTTVGELQERLKELDSSLPVNLAVVNPQGNFGQLESLGAQKLIGFDLRPEGLLLVGQIEHTYLMANPDDVRV